MLHLAVRKLEKCKMLNNLNNLAFLFFYNFIYINMVSSAVLQRTLKLHHYLKRLEKIFITVSANLPKQAT